LKNLVESRGEDLDTYNDQLLKFSQKHLCYEINSLYSALELFAHQKQEQAKNLEEAFELTKANLFLEGIVLHSRCLYEFLYVDPKRKDDASAIHYFDDPQQWVNIRPNNSDKLNGLCYRAGKEIAHLTYKRLNLTEITKNWDLYTITNDLLTTLILFSKNASKNKLHSDVPKTIVYWKECTEYEPGQTTMTSSFPVACTTTASTVITTAREKK
jgi:hypothetical protein